MKGVKPIAEKIARLFHTYYEQLAPGAGYMTRRESAFPWEDVPERNKQLMCATVDAVMNHLFREQNFRDGDEVEVIVPIPHGAKPFADIGERGKLAIREMDFQVTFPGERWWTTIERYELALHVKAVR